MHILTQRKKKEEDESKLLKVKLVIRNDLEHKQLNHQKNLNQKESDVTLSIELIVISGTPSSQLCFPYSLSSPEKKPLNTQKKENKPEKHKKSLLKIILENPGRSQPR